MPNEPPPEHGDLNDRGAEIIRAALEKVREHTDLNDAERRAVAVGLIYAFMEGARLGSAEVAAQAIERGIDVQLNLQFEGADLTPDDVEL